MIHTVSTLPIRLAQQPSDHLAVWLAFSGAIIVALIAAATAQWRLTAQLRAEDQRQQDRLSFERGETDRSELRRILDTLAEHVLGLHEGVGQLNAAAANLVEDDDPDLRDYRKDRLQEIAGEIREHSRAAGDQIERLGLRLGPEGARLVQYATFLRLRSSTVGDFVLQGVTDESVERIAVEREEIRGLREKFMAEALKFTEARLHKPAAEKAPGPSSAPPPGHPTSG